MGPDGAVRLYSCFKSGTLDRSPPKKTMNTTALSTLRSAASIVAPLLIMFVAPLLTMFAVSLVSEDQRHYVSCRLDGHGLDACLLEINGR